MTARGDAPIPREPRERWRLLRADMAVVEDETAEVLELLVDEFVQRHGRLPRDDEVGQWRDAMASAAPTSSALLGEEASEEAMLSAEEAMHASASSDESNSAASDSSGDADQGNS